MNIRVRPGTVIMLEYIHFVVSEAEVIISITPKFLNNPYNRRELQTRIEPFIQENSVTNRFQIMEVKTVERIEYCDVNEIFKTTTSLTESEKQIGRMLSDFYERMQAIEKILDDQQREGKKATLLIMTINDFNSYIQKNKYEY